MATQNATGGFIFGIGARDLEPGARDSPPLLRDLEPRMRDSPPSLRDFESRMRYSPPSLRDLEPGARDFTFKSDILTLDSRNKT